MGRKAKLRASRKPQRILVAGEQAEVFDQQMDADREWFESSDQAFYFRPEIDGEFNEYTMLGSEPPFVHAVVSTPSGICQVELGWVCVVDVGRYLGQVEAPSGCRIRVRTSPPLQADVREYLTKGVQRYLDDFLKHVPDARRKADDISFASP